MIKKILAVIILLPFAIAIIPAVIVIVIASPFIWACSVIFEGEDDPDDPDSYQY